MPANEDRLQDAIRSVQKRSIVLCAKLHFVLVFQDQLTAIGLPDESLGLRSLFLSTLDQRARRYAMLLHQGPPITIPTSNSSANIRDCSNLADQNGASTVTGQTGLPDSYNAIHNSKLDNPSLLR